MQLNQDAHISMRERQSKTQATTNTLKLLKEKKRNGENKNGGKERRKITISSKVYYACQFPGGVTSRRQRKRDLCVCIQLLVYACVCMEMRERKKRGASTKYISQNLTNQQIDYCLNAG